MSQETLAMILFTFVIGANIIWYAAKLFIRLHGGKSDIFRGHFRDFKGLSTLAGSEYSKRVNFEAKVYLYGIPLVIIAMLIFIISLVGFNA